MSPPEAEAEDKALGRTKDEVTMNAWGVMASSIIPGLQFTVDHSGKHDGGTVPMLDFKVWREKVHNEDNPGTTKEKIMYSFYEKDSSNPKVLDRKSAIPHKMMMSTMVQEGVRRLLNTSNDQ